MDEAVGTRPDRYEDHDERPSPPSHGLTAWPEEDVTSVREEGGREEEEEVEEEEVRREERVVEDHEAREVAFAHLGDRAASARDDDDEEEADVQLSFDVQRKSLSGFMGGVAGTIAHVPYGLEVHQRLGRLSIIKKGAWRREYDVRLIERMELACNDARLLHIDWKKDCSSTAVPIEDADIAESSSSSSRLLPRHARHSYVFACAQERQQFYEAALCAMFKRGCLSVPALDITDEKSIYREKISVFVGSWNMGLAPPPASLEAWVPKDKYDLYFIGFQESGWTSSAKIPQTQMLSYMWETQEQEVLFGGLQKLLGPGYTRISQRSLWQMRYVLFVRSELVPNVSNIQDSMFSTGVGGIVGDKGALALTCHLAPHEEAYATRNANYHSVVHGLQLGTLDAPCDLTNRFDYLFWTGDLNYRLALPRDKVLELIGQRDWETLKKHDQLLTEKAKGNCFVGFLEGDINFPPTYRYNRGDRTYSTEKMRTPSWTDRVLWRCLPGLEAKQTAYDCCDLITTSDHSPVYAAFEIDTTRLIPTQPVPQDAPLRYTIVITDLWAKGLIHKFEVKRIEDELKRRDEDRKKRLQRMAEQAKQPSEGRLGQMSTWLSSFWGNKPAQGQAASTSPLPPSPRDASEIISQSTDNGREKQEEHDDDESSSSPSTSQKIDERDADSHVDPKVNAGEVECEEGQDNERDTFIGPAMYIREEAVPVAPYLCFYAPFLDGVKRTPAVGYTRNPVWRDAEVPRLRPFINNKEWLLGQHLALFARDESFWSRSYDDMGQAIIPLRKACGERPVAFSVPLLYEGRPQGIVSGRIHVIVDGMQVRPRGASETRYSSPSGITPPSSGSPTLPILEGVAPSSSYPDEAEYCSSSPSNQPFPSPPSSTSSPQLNAAHPSWPSMSAGIPNAPSPSVQHSKGATMARQSSFRVSDQM